MDSMSFAIFLAFLFCREIETLSVSVFSGILLSRMSNILESGETRRVRAVHFISALLKQYSIY